MKLLFSYGGNNPLDRVMEAQKLLSLLESIFRSPTTASIFMYLLDRGAATPWLIQVNLEIPEASVYRGLKRLRSMELVTPEMRIRKTRSSKGGPRPTVWALLTADKDDVAEAIRDHNRALSPNYRVAEKIVQALLPEIQIPEGITFKMLFFKAGNKLDKSMSNQRIRDISEISAIILREKGIKVWQ